MTRAHGVDLGTLIRLAPPEGTPAHTTYMRYLRLWRREQDRMAALQCRLAWLQSAIAADLARDSPQGFVAAATKAEQFATAAIDVAQLQVFADDVYQRLMACVT